MTRLPPSPALILSPLEGGFVPLPAAGMLTLEGIDRLTFLQNFCTQDLRGMQEGDGRESFITNVQGKVLQHVFILHAGEKLRIVALGSDLELIGKHLDRYIIREQTTIHYDSSNYACAAIGGGMLDEIGLTVSLGHCQIPLAASDPCPPSEATPLAWIIRLPTADRLAILFSRIDAPSLRQCLLHSGLCGIPLAELGLDAWEACRISAGFPVNGLDLTAENLPQEVARDKQAISFTKGCYLGQETVARIDALGHVNRHRVLLVGQGDIPDCKGSRVTLSCLSEESPSTHASPPKGVGEITSACYSPVRGCVVAMGYVRREYALRGVRLRWSGGELQVTDLERSVRQPLTETEFAAVYDLRFRVLREPWGQTRGTEIDPLDSDAYHLAVYGGDGKLLGTGRLHWNSAKEAQIRYMAVEESARGEHVGRDLVWGLESAARKSEAKSVILLAREAIQGFYAKLGYSDIGPGPTLFETIRHVKMRKFLEAGG
jgi:tRNA-modifying protein YgfZ